MSTALAPPQVIDGPTRTPAPFGLFSVLPSLDDNDGMWQVGARWEHLPCDPATGRLVECDPETLARVVGQGLSGATSFSVAGSFQCSPVGWSEAEARARALQHLLVREEYTVERALWTGHLGNTPYLTQSPVDLTPGGAVPPVEAIGLLEQHIADAYGSQGVIHATRRAATVLTNDAVTRQNSRLVTTLGTPVVAGGGYPGTAPGEHTAEVQTVTIEGAPTDGTFTLTHEGETTDPIAFDAPAQDVEDALNALPGLDGVTVTGANPDFTVTFALVAGNVSTLTADGAALTGDGDEDVTVAVVAEGSPDPPDAGTQWVYGSPGLLARRSSVDQFDEGDGTLFDRDTNDLVALAERTYLIGWDSCPVGAVLMEV